MSLSGVVWMVLAACSGPQPEETGEPPETDEPVDTGDPPDTGDTEETGSPPDTGDTGGDTGDDTGEPIEPVPPVASRVDPRDYGYLFWPVNHWTKWLSYHDIQHLQTGWYGAVIDLAAGSFDHLGRLPAAGSVEDALLDDNGVLTDLPAASVRYSVTADGTEYIADTFTSAAGTTSNPSQLVDMGRFMQRFEIPGVGYSGTSDYSGSLQLAAMPRHFVLTHRVSGGAGSSLSSAIHLEGDAVTRYSGSTWIEEDRALRITDDAGDGWVFILPEVPGIEPSIERADDGGLTFQVTRTDDTLSTIAVSLIAVPSEAATDAQLAVWLSPEEAATVEFAQLMRDGTGGETLTTAPFDPQRGVYVVSLSDLSAVGAPGSAKWDDPDTHNWYNRHRLSITNLQDEPLAIPIVFEGGNNAAFYIVGGSPMLRDTDGEPTGLPIQISKNWHETPFWYHLYSQPLLEPGVTELEHTFAHSKWGEAYAAAHAQLCLIGYGQNHQWDESSLGAFGESITYDLDLTLSRSAVDDVRPFLVRPDGAQKWKWTGNVGGANFLVYDSTEGNTSFIDHQLSRMRTHYEYTGPNLTNVVYGGISRDGKIAARIGTQLGRTDDLVRAYYHIEYTFLEDVSYRRLALFQVAADRYADNDFQHYAYGYDDEVLDFEMEDHGTTGYASEEVRDMLIEGDAPWIMLYDNEYTKQDENLGNVGYVIRDYEAVVDGVTTTTPTISIVRTNNLGFSQVSFELGMPYDESGSRVIPAGSTVRATVEYLVPPASKTAYYGESDYLTAMAAEDFSSTAMMRALATGNTLEVEATVGTVRRVQPVELDSAVGPTAVEFTLTGGLGYTPVTIHGLPRPDGWHLEQQVEGAWERVDQSVEGNDYWQAYDDVTEGGFDLVFNVHNRAPTTYRLVYAE